MQHNHRNRIRQALKLLKQSESKAALVISSNPKVIRSHDTDFPYRPNSDLFYLTGATSEDLVLVLRPYAAEQIILLTPPSQATKNLWEGTPPPVKPLAAKIGAKLLTTSDPVREIFRLLQGAEIAYLQSTHATPSAQVKLELASRAPHQLRNLPKTVIDSTQLTAHLRMIKDSVEVVQIKRAAEVSAGALHTVLPLIKAGVSERDIAAFIEYFYRVNGATPAFGSIVATGPSAATLHYHALSRKLKRGELLMIDAGAELEMYASDITRMIPVGEISPQLKELYEVVLAAQLAAIARIKPGVAMKEIHRVAARELTIGLKEIGVLRGSLKQLVAKAAHKDYFPHGIGHSLGIDVHDITPRDRDFILERGMVVTIEPGLYFQKPTAHLPACGVRIEDDILVTAKGCEVLTDSAISKDISTLNMGYW